MRDCRSVELHHIISIVTSTQRAQGGEIRLDSPNEDGTSAAYESGESAAKIDTGYQTTVFDRDDKVDTAKCLPSSYPGCFMTFLISSRIPMKLERG
jgi:hypothetical protein